MQSDVLSKKKKKDCKVLFLVTPLNLCDHKYRWCQEQQGCLTDDSFIIDIKILIFIIIYSWLPIFHKWHYAISFKLEELPLNPCPMFISCICGINFPSSKWSILQTCIFPKYFTGIIPGESRFVETSCQVLLFFHMASTPWFYNSGIVSLSSLYRHASTCALIQVTRVF